MTSPRNARVTSAEELGTMSKNNLTGVTLGIRPLLEIHSLTLPPLLSRVKVKNLIIKFVSTCRHVISSIS